MTSQKPINNYGYIYIRNHDSYENCCKLGKTNNIPERDNQYSTGELKRGKFDNVYEVPNEKLTIIERLLQYEFKEFNIYYDAGTEFYDKKIIEIIEPYFIKIGIKYRKLSISDINSLIRSYRIRQIFKKINKKSLINFLTKINNYKPRKDQSIIIEKSVEYFQKADKGLLILPCGVGKTLISLWITERLQSNKIVIGVPNKLLLKQWESMITVLFKGFPYIVVSGDVTIEKIITFMKNNKNYFIITTYSSSYKITTAAKDDMFDMKINDEVHHLTTTNIKLDNTTKKYIEMLNIPSVKQLSLTATLKHLETTNDNISNDNVKYFGEIIYKKCLLSAINEKLICDYVIQTIITNEELIEEQLMSFNIIDDNDKRLFLSTFASLKSISDKHSHHLLIYSNNKINSLKLVQYIKILLQSNYFNLADLYYSNYHSEMKTNDQKEILNNFKKSKFGIITCVYCLGEGYDNHNIDAVVFAENMTSNIRIVQSALRASRKNKNEPNKITKIILPILNKINWLEDNDNSDLKKIREVIYQIGLEDETIIQKIKVFKVNFNKHNYIKVNEHGISIDEYDDELTQKLKLRTIKRGALTTSYEKARKIIAEKNCRSKEEYYQLCDNDIRLSKEPEVIFKGQFTNWIDYLSIERIYYDLDDCKNKINEYLSIYPDLKKHYLNLSIICNQLCKLDLLFPPENLWVEYYNLNDLREIITISNKKKKTLLA